GSGLAAAGLLLTLRRRGLGRTDLTVSALTLGICWMCLFGPAVEASTFILLAPVMAFEVLTSRRPTWTRVPVYTGAGLLLASVVLFAFPHSVHRPVIALGILPGGCLLLCLGAVGRMAANRPEHVVTLSAPAPIA